MLNKALIDILTDYLEHTEEEPRLTRHQVE